MKIRRKYKILLIGIFVLILIWIIPIPSFIAFKIGLGKSIKGEAVSITGHKPAQYKRFEMLKSVSSTNTLKRLFKSHPSVAVKCYSYWALTERNDNVNYLELLKSNLTDNRKIETMFGCFISSTTVADFLISQSYNVISKRDSIALDSLILYSKNGLESKYRLLMNIPPMEKYYDEINKLAKERSEKTAIIALAKYQKHEDIDLINEELSKNLNDPFYILLAIKNFPDKAFIPGLIKIQNKLLINSDGVNHGAITNLYRTLVRYDNEIIQEHLEKIIEIDNEIQKLKSRPDSIKAISKFEIELLNLKADSGNYIFKYDYDMNDDYTIHFHVRSLQLALLEFPNSKYKYLEERMNLEEIEIQMIKEELNLIKYE